jgi:hypothetical protein
MERLVWTSMLFPGYRPAVFDDIPITAVIAMESVGTGTRYVFTALHRNEADVDRHGAARGACGVNEVARDDRPGRFRLAPDRARFCLTPE